MANATIAPRTSSSAQERIGKYRLLQELEGAEPGTLYAAEEPNTHRIVAVQVMAIEADRLAAFLNESRRLIRLEHPNLATVLDAGEEDGQAYLVREMLQGESLHQRLSREHRLTLTEAIRIAQETAGALAFAHAEDIVHRDLCPDNIWLDSSGNVRLLCFGTCLSNDDMTLLDRLQHARSVSYFSPERAAGESITKASDLFSLGSVFYQMITGELPFSGNDSAALCRAIVFNYPVAPREINPEVSEELNALVEALLAKMPTDRPASADDVEQKLLGWMGPATPIVMFPEAVVFPPSKRLLETFRKPQPMILVETTTAEDGSIIAASPKAKRGWLGDVLAAILLVAGAIGLYLWWKASNEPPVTAPTVQSQAQ